MFVKVISEHMLQVVKNSSIRNPNLINAFIQLWGKKYPGDCGVLPL